MTSGHDYALPYSHIRRSFNSRPFGDWKSRVLLFIMEVACKENKLSAVISSKSPKHACAVCGMYVAKSDNRRLYSEGKKETYCEEIEYIVGESLDSFLQTHVSCRSCRDKAAALINILNNYRQ